MEVRDNAVVFDSAAVETLLADIESMSNAPEGYYDQLRDLIEAAQNQSTTGTIRITVAPEQPAENIQSETPENNPGGNDSV